MCWGKGLGVRPGGDSLLSCGDVILPENSLVQFQAGYPHPCGRISSVPWKLWPRSFCVHFGPCLTVCGSGNLVQGSPITVHTRDVPLSPKHSPSGRNLSLVLGQVRQRRANHTLHHRRRVHVQPLHESEVGRGGNGPSGFGWRGVWEGWGLWTKSLKCELLSCFTHSCLMPSRLSLKHLHSISKVQYSLSWQKVVAVKLEGLWRASLPVLKSLTSGARTSFIV